MLIPRVLLGTLLVASFCVQGFIQDFILYGGQKCEHWPVVPSQMLIIVSVFLKCIDKRTKWLSSKKITVYREIFALLYFHKFCEFCSVVKI